ncbi:MAG: LacI family DNA-binding transcriptional regulator [Lachnospiraceae bacterium]|nr:LacI family DNA-binding transcriptional regulator [Lachnospiraceae bacterium]
MRITSEEIARLANVSRSTVSRVVNNYSNVPEETRKKVMDVIEAYGYEPNSYARVLAGKSSMEIALFISDYNIGDVRWKGMASGYFMRLIAELISKSKEYGSMISVFIVAGKSDYIKIENMYLNRQICGGIFVGFEFQMEQINEMIAKGFNMVVIDPGKDMLEADNVKGIYSENEKAGYLATSYLLKKGYRHIAHIRGDNRLSGQERLKGYQRAMEEAGLRDEICVETGLFERDVTYQAAKKLLSEKQIDAVFTANDMMAIMTMKAAEDLELRVPEDVAVVGCDYFSLYEEVGYRLTTVEISLQETASVAVRAALDLDKRKKVVCKAKIRKGLTA